MTERRRLSPGDRREQLLDVACAIVETKGVAACTVDAVSDAAGVTPQLVHKYFGSRASLLQDLFAREEQRYNAEIHERLAAASDFEDIVRVFVTANFDQLSSATAIGRLRTVPDIAGVQAQAGPSDDRRAERILVRALTAEYPTTPDVTEFVLRLGSAASIEAGNLAAQRSERNREADIDNTVRFILAGIRELVAQEVEASHN